MNKCRHCGCKDIHKIKIKGLPKGLNMFFCLKCWNFQIEATDEFKKKVVEDLSNKELSKIRD